MVVHLLGKTTRPPKCPPYPMPYPAIVPFYPYRVFLPYLVVVFPKCRKKAVPIIRCHLVIAYPQPSYPRKGGFRSLRPGVLLSCSSESVTSNIFGPSISRVIYKLLSVNQRNGTMLEAPAKCLGVIFHLTIPSKFRHSKIVP
jgi:hypothetical protein